MAPVEFLFLSQEDVVAAGGLDMDACLAVIEEALVLHHRGDTVAPQKSALHWTDEIDTDEKHGRIMAMPAYGAGVQARTQLLAVERTLAGISEVRVVDPDAGQLERFVREEARGRLRRRPGSSTPQTSSRWARSSRAITRGG